MSSADKLMDYPQSNIESDARFPGDAGSFSDMHIEMGHWSRPAIPELMSHAHHKMGGKNKEHEMHKMHSMHTVTEEAHDNEVMHDSMSHEEHAAMLHHGHH